MKLKVKLPIFKPKPPADGAPPAAAPSATASAPAAAAAPKPAVVFKARLGEDGGMARKKPAAGRAPKKAKPGGAHDGHAPSALKVKKLIVKTGGLAKLKLPRPEGAEGLGAAAAAAASSGVPAPSGPVTAATAGSTGATARRQPDRRSPDAARRCSFLPRGGRCRGGRGGEEEAGGARGQALEEGGGGGGGGQGAHRRLPGRAARERRCRGSGWERGRRRAGRKEGASSSAPATCATEALAAVAAGWAARSPARAIEVAVRALSLSSRPLAVHAEQSPGAKRTPPKSKLKVGIKGLTPLVQRGGKAAPVDSGKMLDVLDCVQK
eukprot:scaffold3175_cov309-Prasinococcus_capsulatus_cf.AAC.2